MRRIDLAAIVGLTASGITRLLDGLEKSGLVEKESCTSDARVTYAVITAEGRALLARAAAFHMEALSVVFSERFSPEEVTRLAELLGRLPGAEQDASSCPGAAATSAPPPPVSPSAPA